MNWFTRNKADPLQGKWVIDPSDTRAVAEFGQAEIEFKGGRLTYELVLPGKRQIIRMTYQVDGNVLVTDQPSHPSIERTTFQLKGNTLALAFGGVNCRFVRP